MTVSRAFMRLGATGCLITIVVGMLLLSGCITTQDWCITPDGLLDYPPYAADYQLTPLEATANYTLSEVTFTSRDAEMVGLLRMPVVTQGSIPGIVLLPGATVTKEREQGLAAYLCTLGYASLTLDQRNLGVIDMQRDLQLFLNGEEPTEHKMVHDALAAAEILRELPEIDPNGIVYAGESNGARFGIIAGALDPKARGVIAISTCGYGIDAVIASRQLTDPEVIRFYQSIDPETYLSAIPPRTFVMIYSVNDTIIPYENAETTFVKAHEPKELHAVTCETHGYCTEMADALKTELEGMVGGVSLL